MLFVQGTRDNWGVVVTPSGNTPMTLSLPAFLGYPRHLSKFVKSLFSALTMRSTEYPQRFHNVFP